MSAPGPFPERVIDRSELQSPVQRSLNRALTLLAWTAYLYLWLPLATLALWWISVSLGFRELQRTPVFIDVDLFLLLFKAAVIAIVVLIGWAEYNRWRFQGNDRRMPYANVGHGESAARLGTRGEVAEALRHCRNGVVFFDNHAVAIGVRVQMPLPDSDSADRAPRRPIKIASSSSVEGDLEAAIGLSPDFLEPHAGMQFGQD